MITVLLVFLLISIVLLTLCVTKLLPHMRTNVTSKTFALCQMFIMVWIICHITDLFAPNLLAQQISHLVGYLSIILLGPTFFIFALHYKDVRIVHKKWFVASLFVLPAILYSLLLTNEFHGLYFSYYTYQYIENGVAFYVNIFNVYILTIAGMVLLFIKTIKSNKKKLLQIMLIIFAAIVPIVFNLITITNPSAIPYDLTPASFVFSSLLMFIALYKFEFIFVTPMAVNKIMEEMKDAVFVVDQNEKIIYMNESGKSLFLKTENNLNDLEFKSFVNTLRGYVKKQEHNDLDKLITDENIFDLETEFKIPERIIYQIKKQSIYNRYNEVAGSFVLISDTTKYHEITEKIKMQNEKLIQMNIISEELAIERERARISQELHDSLGHSLISIMTLIKLVTLENDDVPNLLKALEISEKTLTEVRHTVSGIQNKNSESIGNIINKLTSDIENIGVKANLIIQGEELVEHKFLKETIFSITREALTNAVRHGKADEVNVVLQFSEKEIKLYIIDNGVGCLGIKPDMGLNGIYDKVNKLKGNVDFYSDLSEGFRVDVMLPIK